MKIESLIKQLKRDVHDNILKEQTKLLAERLLTNIQTTCPVVTGNLRSSFKVELTSETYSAITYTVGSIVDYAPHVEFGVGRPSSLFVLKAIDMTRGL